MVGLEQQRHVAVCGGRDFDDFALMDAALKESLRPNDVVVSGGARGADTLAAIIATALGHEVKIIRAEWKRYGRSAGPIRNRALLASYPVSLLLAFPGGRGTADMVTICLLRGITVDQVQRHDAGRFRIRRVEAAADHTPLPYAEVGQEVILTLQDVPGLDRDSDGSPVIRPIETIQNQMTGEERAFAFVSASTTEGKMALRYRRVS